MWPYCFKEEESISMMGCKCVIVLMEKKSIWLLIPVQASDFSLPIFGFWTKVVVKVGDRVFS